MNIYRGLRMKTIFKEKLGISITDSFEIRMQPFMENCINYLEVRLIRGNDSERMKNFISAACREKQRLGFEIYTVHLPQLANHDISSLDEETRLQAIENQKKLVEMSMCLGASVLVVHPDVGTTGEPDWPKRHEALVKSLKVFAPWCKERGLKIALENLTQISAFQTADILVDVIERVGEDNVGICFDVNHLFLQSHKEFFDKAGKYILTMHVSDYDGTQERHWIPGEGVVDWRLVFAETQRLGFDGTMICESSGIAGADDIDEKVIKLKNNWMNLHK